MTIAGGGVGQTAAWAAIEKDKQFDRFIRRACVTAWTVTLGLLLLYGIGSAAAAIQMIRIARMGGATWMMVMASAGPFLGAVWTVCLLIATLTTVGVFLRLRTASLSEIQLRLVALEDLFVSKADSGSR